MSFSHAGVALLEQQWWCWSQMPCQPVLGLVPAAVPEVQTMGALFGECHQCRLAVAVHSLLAATCNHLTPLHQFSQHTSWGNGWQLVISAGFVPSGASPGPSCAIINEECLQAVLAYQG